MSIRDGLNQKPVTGAAVVAVVLAAAVTIAVRTGSGSPRVPEHRYLYDLDAGELVAGDAAAAGGNRVVARVYACASCGDASKRFIANLEKPDPSADLDAGESPILIRAPGGGEWVAPTSDAGMKIAMDADARCNGMPRSECYPDP